MCVFVNVHVYIFLNTFFYSAVHIHKHIHIHLCKYTYTYNYTYCTWKKKIIKRFVNSEYGSGSSSRDLKWLGFRLVPVPALQPWFELICYGWYSHSYFYPRLFVSSRNEKCGIVIQIVNITIFHKGRLQIVCKYHFISQMSFSKLLKTAFENDELNS